MRVVIFYSIKQDRSYIHTLGCVVKVALPRESWMTAGNGLAAGKKKIKGGSWVWIPKIGIRESGDITFMRDKLLHCPTMVWQLKRETWKESKVHLAPGKPPALLPT